MEYDECLKFAFMAVGENNIAWSGIFSPSVDNFFKTYNSRYEIILSIKKIRHSLTDTDKDLKTIKCPVCALPSASMFN